MVLVRVLERKDASSLIVAIAAGLAVGQFVVGLASSLVSWLFDGEQGSGFDFSDDVLEPVLVFLLAMLLLEGLARLAILARGELVRRRP